jgi:hypothetical protein
MDPRADTASPQQYQAGFKNSGRKKIETECGRNLASARAAD